MMTDKFKSLYMDLAERISLLSYCKNKKVGCIIVDKDGKNILAFGYNGTIKGFENMCEECNNEEIWKISSDYNDHEVSTHGRVKRIFDQKILHICNNVKGYPQVKIKGTYYVIHRLVAKTFISNPNIMLYDQVNHIDGNKENNNVFNLEWCTNRYNCEQRELFQKKVSSHKIGIYYDKSRPKKPYQVRIYNDKKLVSKRFDNEVDALTFLNSLKNPNDYITYKYNGKTLPEVLHAESNALTKMARSTQSSDDSILFTTTAPCIECAKLIIQSGVSKVYYKDTYRSNEGIELLTKANIKTEQLKITEYEQEG